MDAVVVEPDREFPLSDDFREAVSFMVLKFGATVKMPVKCEAGLSLEEALRELRASFEGRGVHVRISMPPVQRVVQKARDDAGMGPHPFFQPWAYFEPVSE